MKLDLKSQPIKATYSNFEKGIHLSLHASSKWRVQYIPQQWAYPVLEGSRLFVFANLMVAMSWNRRLVLPYSPEEYRAIGVTLWFCECQDLQLSGNIQSNPSDSKRVSYWRYGVDPYAGNVVGTLSARAVKLTHLVDVDSWEQAKALTDYGIRV